MSLKDWFSQSISGQLVCLVIFICVAIYIIMAKVISSFYKKMTAELFGRVKGQDNHFNSQILENICGEFTIKVKAGTQNVNTGAIIEKYIPVRIAKIEWMLNYLIAVSTVLGLFGTFLGLSGSLAQLTKVFEYMKDMEGIITGITAPVSHISTAFYTSISGISGSIIMNLVSITPGFSYRNDRNIFYTELEDYLDNEAYAQYSNNYNAILVDFTNKVENSMIYMADKVTKTFDEGIGKFADRINGVSFDITESAKVLTNVIGKLENSVNNFSKPVLSFKESVDNFRIYYEGLDSKIKDIDSIAAELIESLQGIIGALVSNRESLSEVGGKLRQSTDNLALEHDKIMSLVGRITEYSNQNEEQMKSRLEDISKIYHELQSTMYSFKNEINGLSSGVSEGIKNILAQELSKMGMDVSESMKESLNLLRQQNEVFGEKLILLGKTINTHGQLLAELSYTEQSLK